MEMKRYKQLAGYIGTYKSQQVNVSILTSLSMILSITVPFILSLLVNAIQNQQEPRTIILIGGMLMGVTIVSALLNTLQNYSWHSFRVDFLNYFRGELLKATFSKNSRFIANSRDNDLYNRIMFDVEPVAEQIALGRPILLINIIRLLCTYFFMLLLSPKLTLMTLIIIPLYSVLYHIISKRLRESAGEERKAFSLLSNEVQNDIEGINTIKVFGQEKFFLNRFASVVRRYKQFMSRILLFQASNYGVNELVQTLLPVVILLYGAFLALEGHMGLGTLIGFYTYLSYLYEPVQNLSNWYVTMQKVLGMSDRVLGYLERDIEKEVDAKDLSKIDSIKLNHVSFSYDESTPLLKDLNMDAKRGDIVGITGPSGRGKSTLFKLFIKMLDVSQGELLVNGMNIKDVSKQSYYEKLSIVEQAYFVFDGTIKTNICFGADDNQRYESSLAIARVDEFTGVGAVADKQIISRGKNFSGGQKQRIAIARSLVKTYDLLIMDEPSSALDDHLEEEIMLALKQEVLQQNKILIIFTHKLKVLSICNKRLCL